MHAAPCTFEVHNVEFFVEEGVEAHLALLHSLVQVVEHLVVHVLHLVFIFAYLKVLAQFVLALVLHVEVLLQLP